MVARLLSSLLFSDAPSSAPLIATMPLPPFPGIVAAGAPAYTPTSAPSSYPASFTPSPCAPEDLQAMLDAKRKSEEDSAWQVKQAAWKATYKPVPRQEGKNICPGAVQMVGQEDHPVFCHGYCDPIGGCAYTRIRAIFLGNLDGIWAAGNLYMHGLELQRLRKENREHIEARDEAREEARVAKSSLLVMRTSRCCSIYNGDSRDHSTGEHPCAECKESIDDIEEEYEGTLRDHNMLPWCLSCEEPLHTECVREERLCNANEHTTMFQMTGMPQIGTTCSTCFANEQADKDVPITTKADRKRNSPTPPEGESPLKKVKEQE